MSVKANEAITMDSVNYEVDALFSRLEKNIAIPRKKNLLNQRVAGLLDIAADDQALGAKFLKAVDNETIPPSLRDRFSDVAALTSNLSLMGGLAGLVCGLVQGDFGIMFISAIGSYLGAVVSGLSCSKLSNVSPDVWTNGDAEDYSISPSAAPTLNRIFEVGVGARKELDKIALKHPDEFRKAVETAISKETNGGAKVPKIDVMAGGKNQHHYPAKMPLDRFYTRVCMASENNARLASLPSPA